MAQAKTARADARCLGQIGGFLGRLDRVRDLLVAGLTYEEYIAELEGVRATYARIPVAELSLRCLGDAGREGERALNRYIAAAEVWSECVEVPGCQSASIEAELRREWRRGAALLSRAEAALAGR